MQTLATILGYASGFALLGYHEGAPEMIATSIAVDAALAPLTAVIAARRNRNWIVWIVLGFALGAWALAAVLLARPTNISPDRGPGNNFPPTAHAA
jgi:hypothetical protein